MALTLTTTQQAAHQQGIKALIYGKAGYGKTMMAATAPSPLILSAEAGVLSLAKFQIPMIEIKTVEDLTAAEAWLRADQQARGTYQTIYIDSISEIAEVVLANAKTLVKDPRQAYGELIEKMMMTIRAFRDLQGYNVVMTAKQEAIKDGNGVVMNGPSMPGTKLGPALPYMFDEVFRLGVGTDPQTQQNYRFLQTQPDMQNDAKDRSGALEAVESPDLTYIFNKILQQGV